MRRRRPLRIACVYKRSYGRELRLVSMSGLRFNRMAEALARQGHDVDLITNRFDQTIHRASHLREVPFRSVRWETYDVVKTFFHSGMEALISEGGGNHPFIISKLGSVVGRTNTEGVYFFGEVRQKLFELQLEVARRSRIVTLLTNRSVALWWKEHGQGNYLFMVPTGVDAILPETDYNPYEIRGIDSPIALFAGNIYRRDTQPEVNLLWQARLNRIGRVLRARGITLVALGDGDADELDPRAVLHYGAINGDDYWPWQKHAHIGLVLGQGKVQDNESSKIYYYLRTGLPVVCENTVPNSWLVDRTGAGILVDYGNDEQFCDAVVKLVQAPPRLNGVPEYMTREHSWDARASLYDRFFSGAAISEFGGNISAASIK